MSSACLPEEKHDNISLSTRIIVMHTGPTLLYKEVKFCHYSGDFFYVTELCDFEIHPYGQECCSHPLPNLQTCMEKQKEEAVSISICKQNKAKQPHHKTAIPETGTNGT